jgi:hypothetical protein
VTPWPGREDTGPPTTASRRDGRIIPLTIQQRCRQSRFRPESRLNRLDTAFAIRLGGPLNAELLRKSLQEIVARHEVLRARVLLNGQASRQIIDAPGEFELEILYPDAEVGSARRIVEELSMRKCDLAFGPLFTAKLLRFAEQDHVLFWAANHLVFDGYSLNLMFRELWLLYREFIRGRPTPFQAPPASFSRYQAWQADIHRAWMQKHPSYWEHRLAGAAAIQLPTDKWANGASTNQLTEIAISFSSTLSIRLHAFAQRARTTLSLVMMSLYVAVIARWSEQQDFVFNTTVSGRDHREHRQLVGFLAHAIYLRIQLSGHETVVDLLNRVTDEYCRSSACKDFGNIFIDTPELTAGTIFQWLSWGVEGTSGLPTRAESTDIGIKSELFPFQAVPHVSNDFKFSTMLWNNSQGIRGMVTARAEFFSTETLERFVDELRTTAELFVRTPNARISAA